VVEKQLKDKVTLAGIVADEWTKEAAAPPNEQTHPLRGFSTPKSRIRYCGQLRFYQGNLRERSICG
jgi:hypothetical protein